jgi:glycosyltransferase involved in cell wall biosynthesis
MELEKEAIENADIVLANSKRTANYLYQNYRINAELIFPGCIPSSKSDIFRYQRKYLLLINRLEDRYAKHFMDLALKITDVVDDIEVIWAGGLSPSAHRLLKYIRKRDHKGVIHILVSPSDEELKRIYLQSKVYFQIEGEPFDLGALEAAANGVPLVVPKESGVTDLFEHGIHGYFPKEYDLTTISEYILRILQLEQGRYRKMSEAVWERSQQYSWDKHVRALEQKISMLLQ